MPLTAGQWTNAIDQLRSEDFFGAVRLWHNGNQAATYAALSVLNDDTQASIKPQEAELDAAYTRWQTAQTTQTALDSDIQSLQDYAALAEEYHAELKALMLAVTDGDVNSDSTDDRASAIGTVIVASPAAFKNRYNAAFNAESGVSVAGLDVAGLLLLTTAQKQRYISFARYFGAHYGLLLLWRKT